VSGWIARELGKRGRAWHRVILRNGYCGQKPTDRATTCKTLLARQSFWREPVELRGRASKDVRSCMRAISAKYS
jgi:hypothetical protein